MPFPTTPELVNFNFQPNGGPPPTADFGSGLYFGDMVVDGGLCTFEPGNASNFGDAPYTAQTYNTPMEVWATIDFIGTYPYAAVYIVDSGNNVYYFLWMVSGTDIYYALLADLGAGISVVWDSLNEIASIGLFYGSGLGMRAAVGGDLELWITTNATDWINVHTEPSITLSNPVTSGLAMFQVG